MSYLILGIVSLFLIYKIVIGLGRKQAKDALVSTYGLDRKKLDQLTDPQITGLTFQLNLLVRSGRVAELEVLVNSYR